MASEQVNMVTNLKEDGYDPYLKKKDSEQMPILRVATKMNILYQVTTIIEN